MESISESPAARAARTTALGQGLVLAALAVGSALLFMAADSVYYGDAPAYARQIRAGELIEPGHLLWRPLAALLAVPFDGYASESAALRTLQYLSAGSGVLAVLATYVVARRFVASGLALFAATLLALSHGFWAYAPSGCSYSTAVLLSTLAMGAALRGSQATVRPATALAAGALGGLAAAAWAPMALALPAIALAAVLAAERRVAARGTRWPANVAAVAAGSAATFGVPLVVAYLLVDALGPAAYAGADPRTASFVEWLRGANHGIEPRVGAAQASRVAFGWPQSIVSMGDLGGQLRLWLHGEAPLPRPGWLLVPVAFYALVALLAVLAWRAARRGARVPRAAWVPCVLAVILNLGFAFTWQGTDLERYFPSLPFQLLLLVLVLAAADRARAGAGARATTKTSASVLGAIGACALLVTNWAGTFAPALAHSGLRETWRRELARHAGPQDLIVMLGPRKFAVRDPHDPDFPRVLNVSMQVILSGDAWRDRTLAEMRAVAARGGRVLLGDSVLSSTSTPRDGWSFAEYPDPSPIELATTFGQWNTGRMLFAVKSERVWLGGVPSARGCATCEPCSTPTCGAHASAPAATTGRGTRP